MQGLLEGKCKIITGAGSGMGQAMAKIFAEHGAKVLLCARRVEKLEETKAMVEAAGGVAEVFAVDIADEDAVKAMVAAEVEAFGKLDFAVNGASIETKKGMIWEMPTESFHEVLDIDLYGTFYCIREKAKQMVDQGHGGSIVNFSSGAATIGCYGIAPYAYAKAGVNSITKSAALDLGPHNVRVNAVLPGMTKTPMILAVKSHFPDVYDQMERQIPLGSSGGARRAGQRGTVPLLRALLRHHGRAHRGRRRLPGRSLRAGIRVGDFSTT